MAKKKKKQPKRKITKIEVLDCYGIDISDNIKGKISFNEGPMQGLGNIGKW